MDVPGTILKYTPTTTGSFPVAPECLYFKSLLRKCCTYTCTYSRTRLGTYVCGAMVPFRYVREYVHIYSLRRAHATDHAWYQLVLPSWESGATEYVPMVRTWFVCTWVLVLMCALFKSESCDITLPWCTYELRTYVCTSCDITL